MKTQSSRSSIPPTTVGTSASVRRSDPAAAAGCCTPCSRCKPNVTYTTNNGTITITGYTGPGGAVTIPSTINGLPVTSIGNYAFSNCTSLTSVTIPDSVTSIGLGALTSAPA